MNSDSPLLTIERYKKLMQKSVQLYGAAEISAAIDRVAQSMTNRLSESRPILLCVMRGALIFTAELAKRLDFPLQIDYIHTSRYQGGSSGSELTCLIEPKIPMTGRTVIVVEDILDSGITLSFIKQLCLSQGAAAVYTVALVNKECDRAPHGLQNVDFYAVTTPNRFLVGYGLDYGEFFRNLPGIHALDLSE